MNIRLEQEDKRESTGPRLHGLAYELTLALSLSNRHASEPLIVRH
jgi:hypothetical protein